MTGPASRRSLIVAMLITAAMVDSPRMLRGAGADWLQWITAVELKTGKILWQDRSFARSQLLYADGKLIILDEDGTLGLAGVSPQGLKVFSRAPVLENRAWTPPTLAGRRFTSETEKTSLPLI